MLMQCFIHVKANFEKKNLILPFEKFPILVLAIRCYHTLLSIIFAPLFVNWSLTVKKQRKFQTFSFKSGGAPLREVVVSFQEVPNIVT